MKGSIRNSFQKYMGTKNTIDNPSCKKSTKIGA